MRFHAEACAVESWPHDNIRDGATAFRFAFEQSACDVDPASREEFLFGLHIERGKCELPSGAGASDDFAREHEWAAEESSRVRDIAGGNFAANHGAGDNFPIVSDWRNHLHRKAVACAQFP